MTILIPIIAAFCFALLTGFSGYNIGQKVERSAWQQRELEVQAEGEKKAAERRERNAAIRLRQANKLAEVIDGKERENAKLRHDVDTLSKRGLYVTATKCKDDRAGVPGETTSPNVATGTSDRVRLPEPIESDLIALAQDAQLVVQQYNQCRGVLAGLVVTVQKPEPLPGKNQIDRKTWTLW